MAVRIIRKPCFKMKAVFCLAVLCCLIAGSLGAGCDCEGIINCACRPPTSVVVKGKVKERIRDYGAGVIFKIIQIDTAFLGRFQHKEPEEYYKYAWVPNNCDENIKIDEVYLFIGKDYDRENKMVACHVVNGFVTVKNNVDDYAFEFLWAMRKHGKQAACAEYN